MAADAVRSTWPNVLIGALAALVVTFIAIMAVVGAVIPPLVVFSIVFALLAVGVVRWPGKRWLLIVAAVLVLLAILSNLPFIIEDLTHPETIATFFLPFASVVAGIVAIIAAILAWMRKSSSSSIYVVGGAVAIVVVALVVSLVATLSVSDDARAEGDVVVTAEDIEYPEKITVPAGTKGLYIENKDVVRHTFVIEGQDVKKELPGSTNKRLEIDLPRGEYEFKCDVPGHERMEGVLEVS
jgi:plastocyanin